MTERSDRVLASLTRSASNILQVVAREWQGHPLVDIRRYFRTDTGQLRPTKRGLSIPREQWPALVQLIDDANMALSALDADPFAPEPERADGDLFGPDGSGAAPEPMDQADDQESSPLRQAVHARARR